ncbi:eukaryotic-like serine/threonine-protein kinase [Oryzomicrobium terrae]|uniref:Eukaryotic-like serine/threonine-protein kinase n=1 Tax=Oryzomicrobium terrae TaxID=1735038 RepID=A0A5C1E7I1_9RHOO|nr:protein kinase [Oryzomicrobium terrae]QEL64549.1 eukaryotic-like serine/threonine-protein kinase [Oryzomicrobium terrae]
MAGAANQPKNIGRYEVLRELGKGATATVYLARDPDSGREVAIKYVRFGGAGGAALSRRLLKLFNTEHGVGQRLDHPNIVKIYDAVVESTGKEPRAYLVMEFVDGTALDQYIHIDRLLPFHKVVGIIFKCCLALDHAARQGVVHRDIKPANILIDKEGNPKITDFGLALNLQKDKDRDSTFVMGVGSPAYMSPEQVKGYPLNHKTDLYSLGVLLFQLLTGRLPFRADNPASLVYKIVNMEPPAVCALNPAIPAGMDPILKKALEKDLYNRYRSGADFAKDLSSVRYQILDDEDDVAERDRKRFMTLRGLPFFRRFEDVELWEILRISTWQEVPEKVALIRELTLDKVFGVIVSGQVEVSYQGRSLARLESGEVVGEMAYLDPEQGPRSATVVTLAPTVFLEISAAAMALSSDELQERFHRAITGILITRLRQANKSLAKLGAVAVRGSAPAPKAAPGGLALLD